MVLLDGFVSGYYENSLYKGIPIGELDYVKGFLSGKFPNNKFRIRYRGPRIGMRCGRVRTQCQQDCLKRFAKTFSVYRVI